MDDDPRLGDRSSHAQRARSSWVNKRLALSAGWTQDEWDVFVASGQPPRTDRSAAKEEQEHGRTEKSSIY